MSYAQNNENLAREQLRPYVMIPEFRQYVKEKVTQWELWHRSHTEKINEHEGLRDKFHQELKELQGRDFRHSDFDPLGHAETCYGNYRYIAAKLKDNPGYKLLADREPVLFKEASVASIVALFWCDVNDSTWLVPEYDFLEPEGPFIEYLREQREKPIQGRYKHIDWFVEAATNAYESAIKNECAAARAQLPPAGKGEVGETSNLNKNSLKRIQDQEVKDPLGKVVATPPTPYQTLWDYAQRMWTSGTDKFKICEHISNGPGNYSECLEHLVPNTSRTDQTKRFHSVCGPMNKEIRAALGLEVYRPTRSEQILVQEVCESPISAEQPNNRKPTSKKTTTKRKR